MSTTPTPLTFHHWWMNLSKVAYMTKEEVAYMAWNHSAHEQGKVHRALKRGNTKLIEALMDMVNQHFTEGHSGGLTHSFMSCDEGAIEVLIEAGLAEEVVMGNYVLFWDKLEERKRDEQKV